MHQAPPLPGGSSHADTLITVQQVRALLGCSRAFVYEAVRDGRFPPPAVQATRFTRWRASDVDAWIRDPAAWLNKGKEGQQ